MKKTLSLILAALMCAAMTPAVMAEEVAETPAAPVEDTAVIEEIAADDAGIMLISELEDTVAVDVVVETVVVDAEAILALAASYEVVLPEELVAALLAGEIELTAEALAVYAAALELELPAEFVTALLALFVPAADVAVEEAVAVEEVVAAEEVAVEAIAEEAVVAEEEAIAEEVVEEVVVEEEVSKYPVILEETPTFGLFTKILSKFTFRG